MSSPRFHYCNNIRLRVQITKLTIMYFQLLITSTFINSSIYGISTVSRKQTLIYKVILKPIWTYGIELWGCAKPSNIKILQTYQSKTSRMITNAPWYVSNQTLHDDLKIPFISDVIYIFRSLSIETGILNIQVN
jgi:hypothetical protein